MAKFRKRPVVIDAVQVHPGCFSGNPVISAESMLATEEGLSRIGAPTQGWKWRGGKESGLVIPTLEGDHLARPGDWVIKGVQGEFYPCKPDIFAATYEPA
ncbi:hypothetical protein OF122_13025 [Pelagibacterium flavum]|uniref:Uncharacterized protein n=1 Tax=Pelagibacterium flavum TaxID=2984530 RepID=A0ABY6IK51_9HYPH|nr:hypothetical protein [Pelagibacterium sp. YIM 151497]UYQ70981.1 hypothetical protein OF122_13025 [Pelagibacterium sp. YIM 151497]